MEMSTMHKNINEKFTLNLFDSEKQLKQFDKYVRKSWTPVNKKVIKPSSNEIEINPRSRSAKLRKAIKN